MQLGDRPDSRRSLPPVLAPPSHPRGSTRLDRRVAPKSSWLEELRLLLAAHRHRMAWPGAHPLQTYYRFAPGSCSSRRIRRAILVIGGRVAEHEVPQRPDDHVAHDDDGHQEDAHDRRGAERRRHRTMLRAGGVDRVAFQPPRGDLRPLSAHPAAERRHRSAQREQDHQGTVRVDEWHGGGVPVPRRRPRRRSARGLLEESALDFGEGDRGPTGSTPRSRRFPEYALADHQRPGHSPLLTRSAHRASHTVQTDCSCPRAGMSPAGAYPALLPARRPHIPGGGPPSVVGLEQGFWSRIPRQGCRPALRRDHDRPRSYPTTAFDHPRRAVDLADAQPRGLGGPFRAG